MIRIYGNGLTREEILLYLKALNEAIGTLEIECMCPKTSCYLCKGKRICRELHQMEDYLEIIRDKKIPPNKNYFISKR